MKAIPTKLLYEFGEFRLDTDKHRLLRDGEIVALTPKAVEALTVLVQQRGKLVERDQLMNFVWPDAIVEPGNLDVTISRLRKALGENDNSRKFIETVPRLGYKFVAEVREVVEQVPALIVEKHTAGRIVIDEEIRFGRRNKDGANLPSLSSARRALSRSVVAVAAGALILTGGFFAFRLWRANTSNAATANIKSVAVLPFRTIGSTNPNSHQGLGLADVLITRLSNINRFKVRPTSAVATFENTQEDSLSIARKLQTDAVLEGTIYYSGDNVRVTGRLIKVGDQSTIWSGQFERLAKNELQLQNEISLQIANALAVNLNNSERTALSKPYTNSADAYQLYVQGRYEWNKRSYNALSEAERLFRNALEIDPNFALAYVGLADSLVFLNDKQSQVGEALDKALKLDPNLAEAYATLGFNEGLHYWRWKQAEEAFKKSLALNPGYATAHQWYATLLVIEGRTEEAKAELQRALEIDPNSYNFLGDLGQAYYHNREYDKAKEYCERALSINSDFPMAHGCLSRIYYQTGEYERAIEEEYKSEASAYRATNQSAADEKATAAFVAEAIAKYRRLGIRKFLEYGLAKSQAQVSSPRDPSAPYGWAWYYAFLGEKEKALDNLEKAYENGAFMVAWVKAEPNFDNLRSEPRYQAIVKKLGL